jgi:deoxyribonuclease-1
VRRTVALSVILYLTVSFLSVSPAQSQNTRIDSFNEAKKILLHQIYYDHRQTFYCGCDFTPDKEVTLTNGYVPKKKGERAKRIEWDHIVPAENFGKSFREWREGDLGCVDSKGIPFKGRNCAQKVNMEYRFMQADMYNLVPVVGELNGLRSNYSFAMIPGEKGEFGSCDIEIEDGKIEPPPQVRGDIARTYMYMDLAYPGHGIISRKNKKLFEAWDREDPVDRWECERCKRIEWVQGNENPVVKERCARAGM